MKQTSTEAVVRISSRELSADDMQKILEFSPSRLTELKSKRESKDARLIIKSTAPEHEPTEAHIAELCSVLSRVRGKLSQLPSDTEIDIWCTIYSEGEFVGLALDHALISDMDQLGLSLIISYYERSDSD